MIRRTNMPALLEATRTNPAIMMPSTKPDYIADLEYSTHTDVGMRRANNQDNHTVVLAEDAASWRERGHLFIVADGMGAHAAGELASKLAVDSVPHLYHHFRDLSPGQALERAISETNSEIHRRGLANPDFHNMGTTCVALTLQPQGAIIGHVGDSRAYRLRGDRIEQLTFDHSLVWELQAAGQFAENTELARSVPKNVITRSLGPNPTVAVDIEGPFALEPGDTFLLCSDGLSGQVADHEIGSILANLSPEEAAQVLVDLANLRGGPDNSTVIIAKIAGQGLASVAARQPLSVSLAQRLAGQPAPWIAAGVCLFLALVLKLAEQTIPAVVAAAAAVVSVVVGLVLGFRAGNQPVTASSTDPIRGKAPYRHATCKPGAEFVQTLSGILQELRNAAEESNWHVDWEQFTSFRQAAETATRARQHAEAVRCYAKAISFMMDELRHQRGDGDQDSSDRIKY